MEKTKNKIQLNVKDILEKKILILGDVGSGKTSLIAQLLPDLMEVTDLNMITIIDMAPEMIGEVGGKLTHYIELPKEIRYLSPHTVYAPRYSGKTKEEVLKYANRNRESIEPLLKAYIKEPSETLIINDLTIYLHSGNTENVLGCVEKSRDFLASAYYGSFFRDDKGTIINKRERILINEIMLYMDRVIKI